METLELRCSPFSSSRIDSNVFGTCVFPKLEKLSKAVILGDVVRKEKEKRKLLFSLARQSVE